MSMSCKLWLKFKDYLEYDEDGTEIGLREDAPTEAKESYEKDRIIHGNLTESEWQMVNAWFSIIRPYIITTSRVIRDDAPFEAKEACENLKNFGILLGKNGAIIMP